MTSLPTALAFTDLETTHTDPYNENAAPLEIAIILTDSTPDLNVIAQANLLIRPPGAQPEHDLLWSRMDPFIRDMHSANGLWQLATGDDAWNVAEADVALANWIRGHVGDEQVPIAGSGVGHMDQPWVKEWFPSLAARLTYYPIDFGAQRRILQLAGRHDHVDIATDVDAKPHRALDDVTLHVAEARRYLRMLQTLPPAHSEETEETDGTTEPSAAEDRTDTGASQPAP